MQDHQGLTPGREPLAHPSECHSRPAVPQPETRSFIFCYGTLHILYADRKFADVTFTCSDGVTVDAHKFVLATRSEYFKKQLYRRGDNLDENTKHKHYRFCSTSSMLSKILEYLYTGVIGELECEETIADEQRVNLWIGLLNQALDKSLGRLDEYLCALLVRRQVEQHKAAASLFTFATERLREPKHEENQQVLREVQAAMAQALLQLTFTEDCLVQLSDTALQYVLELVPFDVSETEVIKAVAAWARENLMDEEDKVQPEILQHLDLNCVGAIELADVVEPFKLFDAAAIGQAWEFKALNPDLTPGARNPNRGRDVDWTDLKMLDDAASARLMEQLQAYTTFEKAQDFPAIPESSELGSEPSCMTGRVDGQM